MKTAIPVSLLVFALVLGALAPALAAPAGGDDEARFFVQSTSGFWRNTLGVRNDFEDGFTSGATGIELQLAKLMGIQVYPVYRLSILQQVNDVVLVADDVEIVEEAEPTPEPRVTPTDRVSWGVSMMYGESGVVPSGGASVSVAILDTGVHGDHPDLVRRVADCRDFTQRDEAMVSDACVDENGHGTHVAGIVAADGGEDGTGIVGVAPEADLMIYKVCDEDGSCWSDDIAVGIRVAVDEGAHIITLGLGSDDRSSLIEDAVAYAHEQGVLVVAAAGNDGPYEDSIDYPAAFSSVVAVAALDVQYDIAEWSSRGLNGASDPSVVEERDIELAAPGVNIESTFRDGEYAILSGTSMAAPHVAGLAAVMWQFGDEDDVDEAGATYEAIQALTLDILPSGDDDASGAGLPVLPIPVTE